MQLTHQTAILLSGKLRIYPNPPKSQGLKKNTKDGTRSTASDVGDWGGVDPRFQTFASSDSEAKDHRSRAEALC
eukprot:2479787-Amphidinium_carterae.1